MTSRWAETRVARRSLRLALPVIVAGVAALTLGAFAPPANAAVWVAPGETRVFPSTPPGANQSVQISAAGNEYQGVIVGLRGGADRHNVTVTWSPDSDPLLVQNSVLDEVKFVRVKRATTDSHGKTGLYPDPLVPRAFGAPISVPSSSYSLYVLFHVPYGTSQGVRTGTLHVVNGDEVCDLPVSLQVWPFGWQRLSVHTAFATNMRDLQASIRASGVKWSGTARATVVTNFYRMMQEHGLTPMMPNVVPRTAANGSIDESSYLKAIEPLLGTNGLDLPDTRLPWCNWFPAPAWHHNPSSPTLLTYLTNVCSFFARNGWQQKAYAYVIDEPTSVAAERLAERYARVAHAASRRAGFRIRFLLTDDPRPTTLNRLQPANKFLWDDVDIWCTRYYYFFGRVPIVRQLQARGVQFWWYPYANTNVSQMPNFVLEKSLADDRVWGWLMYQWNVDGLLYFGFNRWGDAATDTRPRDPYADPLSFRKPNWSRVANGEAMLVYPGYYPRYGLNDPMAPPVSSLRLEALRDGFEDLEYMKLAAATGTDGDAFVRLVIKSITWYPYPIVYAHRFLFPKYATAPNAYLAAREKLAERIVQYTD